MALVAGTLPAQEPEGGGPVPAPGALPSGDLESQVEDLTQRVHGMEGKLRESAAARKAADQARMEAERRLAEGAQELARLRAEVSLLKDAKEALEVRLRRAEEQAERAAQARLAAEESARRLGAELARRPRTGPPWSSSLTDSSRCNARPTSLVWSGFWH